MEESFEFIECAICNEEINDYGLPFSSNFKNGDKKCKHSFCSNCLKEYIQFREEKKNELTCPICRESFDGFLQSKISNDLYKHARSIKTKQMLLQNENKKLNDTIIEISNDKINSTQELKRKVQELEDYKSKHLEDSDISKNRIKELEVKIQELEQERLREMQNYQLKIDGQQQQLLSAAQNNRELLESNQQFHLKNQELTLQINELLSKIEESKLSIKNRDYQIEKIELEKRDIQKKVESMEQFTKVKFNEQNSVLRSKDSEIMNLVEANKSLVSKLNESQSICENYKKNYESIKEDSSNGFKRIKDLEGAISSLQIELGKYSTVVELLTQKNKALEKAYEDSKLPGGSNNGKNNSFTIVPTINKISNSFGYLMGSKQNFNDITKPYKYYKIEEKRGNKNTNVYRATTPSGDNLVLKLIPINNNKSNNSGGYTGAITSLYNYYTSSTLSEEDILAFRESMILYTLNNPNILKLESITKDEKNNYYSVLSPFVQYDLEYVLLSNQNSNNKISPTTLTWANIKFILYQLISAVYYLHSRDLVHRDIKPTSILLLGDNQLKLCSFGLAASVFTSSSSIPSPHYTASSYCYLSPEYICSVLEKEKSASFSSSSSADIDWKAFDMWSIGCIFLELLFKFNLFKNNYSNNNNSNDSGISGFYNLSISSSSSKISLNNILYNITSFKESSPKSSSLIIKDKPFLANILGKPEKDFQSIYREYIKKNSIGGIIQDQDQLSIPSDAYNLLCSLLSFNPQTRIKAHHAVFHQFFSNETYYKPESTSVSPNSLNDISSSLTDRNIIQFIKEKCSNLIQV